MEILKEQRLVYLTRRQTEVMKLKESLSQSDFEFPKMVGHRLKGHGETFGFPKISQIGEQMERAAMDKDQDKLKESINLLDVAVEENLKRAHL